MIALVQRQGGSKGVGHRRWRFVSLVVFGCAFVGIGVWKFPASFPRLSALDRVHALGEADLGSSQKKAVLAGQPMDVRLMSLNLRYEHAAEVGPRAWRNRVVPIVRRVAEEEPDILAVQEALHGQVADLWVSLVRHAFVGCGRDDGHHTGEFTGIFYRRDRFQQLEGIGGPFWLSDTPEVPGSKTWGNQYPRLAWHVRLRERASGRMLDVFTTHWDHRSQSARERSARLMAERMRRVHLPKVPMVLLGDFNAIEVNPAMLALKAAGKPEWLDVYGTLHPREGARSTLHFWRASREGRLKVDHIWVSRPARLISARIVDEDRPAISDHFPVTARVVFP